LRFRADKIAPETDCCVASSFLLTAAFLAGVGWICLGIDVWSEFVYGIYDAFAWNDGGFPYFVIGLFCLLLLLGTSLVGFMVIPAAFFLQGMAFSVSAALRLGARSDLRGFVFDVFLPYVLLLSAALWIGSEAFNRSRSLCQMSLADGSCWHPVSGRSILKAAVLITLSVLANRSSI